jgi:hypothetical protein
LLAVGAAALMVGAGIGLAAMGMQEKMKSSFGHSLVIGNLPSDVKDVSDMDDKRISEFVSEFDDEISYILQ